MATRTLDIRTPTRRSRVAAGLIGRTATGFGERRETRRTMRRLMADRPVGRETGARI